ncbi:hypothetical protein [Micromonospora sp. NPDC048839]|uniref:hypothetical protein n=1 Tax=Micromonospora sp. NPDC048839 TaxID=3155641 RepID=UPI0033FF953E
MRLTARVATVLSLAAVAVATAAAPAAAEKLTAYCGDTYGPDNGWHRCGIATFDDPGNIEKITVMDQNRDGHSVVAVWQNQSTGAYSNVWHVDGVANSTVEYVDYLAEGTPVRFKVCAGEGGSLQILSSTCSQWIHLTA